MSISGSHVARLAGCFLALTAPLQESRAQHVDLELLTAAPASLAPAGGSWAPRPGISADARYVVVITAGPDVAQGVEDTNGATDVFLLDRVKGKLSLLSHRAGMPGIAANGGSSLAVISRNGRYVAFSSIATDLVAGQEDDNRTADVFLVDTAEGRVRLVSHLPGSAVRTPTRWSNPAAVSDNGWVLFYSEAKEFAARDTADSLDAFLYDPVSGRVRLVSHVPGDPEAPPPYGSPQPRAISGDGRWSLFDFWGTALDASLPAPDYNRHAYLYDRDTDTSFVVSRVPSGPAGNFGSEAVAMTPDGAHVLFGSHATNLATVTDENQYMDSFLYSRETGQIEVLSLSPDAEGRTLEGETRPIAMSVDARRVLLRNEIPSDIIPIFPVDTASATTFVRDRAQGSTLLVSHYIDDPSRRIGSEPVALSADGAKVLYRSYGNPLSDIVDENRASDVFLYDIASRRASLVSGVDGGDRTADGNSWNAQFSANGDVVVLHSEASDLVTGIPDYNGYADLFVVELDSRRITAAAVATGRVTSTSPAHKSAYAMLPDGSGVAINGSGFVMGDTRPGTYGNAYFLHRARKEWTLLSRPPSPYAWNTPYTLALSDGHALMASSAPGMGDASIDQNGESDVFVASLDGGGGGARLVSRSILRPDRTANNASFARAITPSGRFVLFDSRATDLVGGVVDSNQDWDVFVFDRERATMDLVSTMAGTPDVAAGSSASVGLSDDGRWVLLQTNHQGLVTGRRDSYKPGAFLVDRETRSARMVSHRHGEPSTAANNYSFPAKLSPDGRWVLYASAATDLVAGVEDANEKSDVFVYDRESGGSRLVSHRLAAPAVAANGSSRPVALTPDGRYVLFDSDAFDLLYTGDLNNKSDVFRHDRETATTALISAREGSGNITAANGYSRGQAITADGRRVLFNSDAPDLVVGSDTNRTTDAFVFDFTDRRTVLLSRSHRNRDSAGNDRSYGLSMTTDGSGVLLVSEAGDLTHAIDVNRNGDVFYAAIDFTRLMTDGFEERVVP